ncbi:ZIP family metal transporter [Pseudoxanthomonas mexicana]|uniref:ZIP family metal transporter n=1 Tax=Pseudoxanthomonas mexicana TaxID=128785 RepID=UPI00398B6912
MNRVLRPLAHVSTTAWPSLLGIVVLLASGLLALHWSSAPELQSHGVWRGLRGGALCGLATALGALPVLVVRGIPRRLGDALLGFGAGVMLAASAFSLVLPGLEAAQGQGYSSWGAGGLVSIGLLLGAMGLLLLDRVLAEDAPETQRQLVPSRVMVFVLAIALHNIPEGMAVGVAAGGGLPEAAGLAMGIALQDIPEGLVVALVLAGAGMARTKAVFVGVLSGVAEPLAAVASAWAMTISTALLPWGLAFAAGAMLIAVVHSVVPESTRGGNSRLAALGLAIGFCVMMVLDTALAA